METVGDLGYYAQKGQDVKGKKALQRINGGVSGFNVDREYEVLKQEIADAARATSTPWADLFRGTNLRRTLAATLGIASQQVIGTALYFIFSAFFFAAAGLQDPFLASLIIFILLNVFTAVSFWTTEKVGRRRLMLVGCALLGVFDIALGITGSVTPSVSAQKAALAMTCLWVVTYALTAGPVGSILAAELGTSALRSKTTSFAFGVYGCINLIFTFCIPLFLDQNGTNWGVKAGYMYGGLAFVTVGLVYVLIPETAGRTFAELDELYDRGVSVRRFAETETAIQRSGQKK